MAILASQSITLESSAHTLTLHHKFFQKGIQIISPERQPDFYSLHTAPVSLERTL